MKGIILAAGRGSRLGHVTEQHPKCLTLLAGKPLLEWQIASFVNSGISDIAIVTGYRSHQLKEFSDTEFHNARWAETNMVVSLQAAKEWLTTDVCIVSYSDIVYHPDILQKLCSAKGDLVITYDALWQSLWSLRFENILEDAETFKTNDDGFLVEIGQKAESENEIKGQYMGLLKFAPQGWQAAQELLDDVLPAQRDKMDMTSLLSDLIARQISIQTVAVEGRWCEVDNISDLEVYEKLLESGDSWRHDWRF